MVAILAPNVHASKFCFVNQLLLIACTQQRNCLLAVLSLHPVTQAIILLGDWKASLSFLLRDEIPLADDVAVAGVSVKLPIPS